MNDTETILFDRHKHMTKETLSDVMNIIDELMEIDEIDFSFLNFIYGLLDGYNYNLKSSNSRTMYMLKVRKDYNKTYLKLVKIFETISKYPKLKQE